ncbi:MAG: hypothetical protein QF502_06220, partial [Nitrospinaceae bacterium]|nr:hypothetical protein [Nitrospinaceae bacterium]
ALRDILLQCNAFWLDQDASQVCNHATVAEVYVASDEIVLKFPAEDLPDLPGGSQGNFCASAQHVSSPNTYSIDSASLISDTEDCGGAGGSVQTASVGGSVQPASVSPAQTFASYNNTIAADICDAKKNEPALHTFALVKSDGTIDDGCVRNTRDCIIHQQCDTMRRLINNPIWANDRFHSKQKLVYVEYCRERSVMGRDGLGYQGRDDAPPVGCVTNIWHHHGKGHRQPRGQPMLTSYNFETGTWSNDQGEKFKNGKLVE